MNKKTCLILAIVLVAMTGWAQQKKNKPQTPQPPYKYNTDSVEYENADKSVHLGATFSYPKSKGPFITMVMITGSGQQDRDETLLNHKPFAIIADYLTNLGYAVLRVDDRGIGKSRGDLLKVTSREFADDVMTSIQYLLTRKDVNKKKIGVIGHSEGGFIAPMIYAKWPQLAFIVSLAGTGVSGKEILLRQQTDPLKLMVSKPAFDAFYIFTERTLGIIYDHPVSPDSVILSEVKSLYTNWKLLLPDSIANELNIKPVTPEIYASQFSQLLIPWLRYFISTEPTDFWKQVKCPVLALNGEKDIQVDAVQNTTAISNALKAARNKKATIHILPGLNHLFQTCKECTVQEYEKLDESFSPVALKAMSDWLKKTIK